MENYLSNDSVQHVLVEIKNSQVSQASANLDQGYDIRSTIVQEISSKIEIKKSAGQHAVHTVRITLDNLDITLDPSDVKLVLLIYQNNLANILQGSGNFFKTFIT